MANRTKVYLTAPHRCIMATLLSFILLTLVLPLLSVNAVASCPLQGSEAGTICAMCSDSNAAVRWRAISQDFDSFFLRYACSDPNGTVIFEETGDGCFTTGPIRESSDPRTGVSSVGHKLQEGYNCNFRLHYAADFSPAFSVERNCTIKTAETCAANPGECQVDRIIVNDTDCQYQCAEGYTGELCNNIDECEPGNVCGEYADCHDTDGSYWCECWPGFQGDGYNCTDIDVCLTLNETCYDENAHCVNTEGSFTCQCNSGFTGEGYNCSDIDECETGIHGCSVNANCSNQIGSYECECWPGFQGDGNICLDVDECLTQNETCYDENAHCVNTVGKFTCQCNSGFTGDGYNCSDVNECIEGLDTCPNDTYCFNINGSYQCNKSKDSSGSVAAVVSGVILGTILLLVLTLAIAVVAVHSHCRKKSKPSFHELTTKDLDPYYTPSFWNGSLTSVHSTYEMLIPMTDISKNSTESHKDNTSVSTAEQVNNHNPVEPAEGNAYDISDSHHGYCQDQDQDADTIVPDTSADTVGGVCIFPNTSSTSVISNMKTTSKGRGSTEDCATESYGAVGIVIEEDDIVFETTPSNHHCTAGHTGGSSCDESLHQEQSYPAEGLLSGLHPAEVCTTSNGYISEDSINELTIPSTPNNSDHVKNEHKDIVNRTTQYITESVSSGVFSSDYEGQESYFSDDLKQNNDRSSNDYPANSVSTGYVSESEITETMSKCGLYNITAREYLNTNFDDEQPSCTTDTKQADIDSVKFTVDSKQEFDYVNAIEDTMSDISFDIMP